MAKKKNNKTNNKKKEKVVKTTKNTEKVKKETVKKEKKNDTKVVNVSDNSKKSLWTRFRIFCHGVAVETRRVHWANKETIIKYSIATVVFVVFLALFFYGIDVIFAAVRALFK